MRGWGQKPEGIANSQKCKGGTVAARANVSRDARRDDTNHKQATGSMPRSAKGPDREPILTLVI